MPPATYLNTFERSDEWLTMRFKIKKAIYRHEEILVNEQKYNRYVIFRKTDFPYKKFYF